MAGDSRFGRLVRIAANSSLGWRNEASDFTPWLAENLDRLGEALGLSLELREREHRVGRYSLDLLLEDARGRTVIVENQFGATDHDHLGKLLTYCAGTGADVIVWLAETLSSEHRAALEWLNDNTRTEISFFGVELELLTIGDSEPAPHFRVVIEPNEIVKERPAATATSQEWSWEAFARDLRIPESRLSIGRALVQRIEAEALRRGIGWFVRYRKGYVAFQQSGGYNVVVVDLYWRRAPRVAVKLPAAPSELGLTSPYPALEGTWSASEREWGWTVPALDELPDIGPIVDFAQQFARG
ncbi:MAG: hypothetical protein U0446_10385 [Dehalococcoidia bacterium]